MTSVYKTSQTDPLVYEKTANLDTETLSYLIGCTKIRQLEKSLDSHFFTIESRLAEIKTLHNLRQKVIESPTSYNLSTDEKMQSLLEEARELGLDWKATGWKTKEERDNLVNSLQILISGRESENQTTFMRINRVMNLRSETANLFSKVVSDSHNQSLKILSRIERR